MDARHVADAAVAAADQHAARKRSLRRDDDVEPIYQQVSPVDGFERQAGSFARFPLLVGAGGSCDRQSLAFFERETVADQFQRSRWRVTAAEQPRKIMNGLPQNFLILRREQFRVPRMRAAMSMVVGTHFTALFSRL
jgi:hypothetical protein